MRLSFARVLVILLLIFSASIAAAQDDDPYADIPQTRTEDGGFVLGDPEALVTIIEFSDFLCPACQTYKEVVDEFIADYVAEGLIRFEYRFFPVVDENMSPYTSALAECVGEQDAFWPAHDILFDLAADRAIDAGVAEVVADELELDLDTLEDCIPEAMQFVVDANLAIGLDVNSTPTLRIRIGDETPALIQFEGQVFDRGGVPLEVLAAIAESDTPEEFARPGNQLRDDRLLQDTSIVTGEPCSAPCWREIIPGETSWADALAIVEGDDDLANVQSQQDPTTGSAAAIWGQTGGEPCCQMFSSDGELVSFVLLQTAPIATLEEVIDVHGEPDYLTAETLANDDQQGLFTLFYENIPMLVYVFFAGVDGELGPEGEILGYAYMDEEFITQVLMTNALWAWDGYKAYSAYLEDDFALEPAPEMP